MIKKGEKPVADKGVAGQLDVIERADGGCQVIYKGLPSTSSPTTKHLAMLRPGGEQRLVGCEALVLRPK